MSRPKKEPVSSSVLTLENAPSIKKSLQVPGLFDIVTSGETFYDVILKHFQQQARVYGFNKLETPPLEDLELYSLYYDLPESSLVNILKMEVGSRDVAMRPEILPSVLRAYAQHRVFELEQATKWMYFGSVLKYDKKKQLESDYNLGVEVFGNFSHLTETQTISCMWHLFKGLGLQDITLEINHIGETQCQKSYEDALSGYFSGRKYDLCDTCSESLNKRSMNVLRCSNLECQSVYGEAPNILDFLEEHSKKTFTNILEALDEVEIPYQLNPYYVGKDGLSKTNCRIVFQAKESTEKIVLSEGGYHDGLISRVGGKNWCAFGMQASVSTIAGAMKAGMVTLDRAYRHEVYLVPLGELASKKSLKLFHDLAKAQISVFDQFGDTGVKNQLKMAIDSKTPIALIMGQKEALDDMVILRDVKSGMQEMFSYDKIIEEVKKRLGK